MTWQRLRQSPWAIPTFLLLTTSAALITALAADGVWDVLSWAALALPLVIIGWAVARGARR